MRLPDFIEDGSAIRVFAGIEQVARKMPGQPWEVKVERCALCGKCCEACEYLKERPGYRQANGEWAMMCGLNTDRPQSCGNSDGFSEDCLITWRTVKG